MTARRSSSPTATDPPGLPRRQRSAPGAVDVPPDDEAVEVSPYTLELDDAALPGAVADPIRREFDFDERLRSAPDRPGVYLMRDRHGVVCYVGKAASLRTRLRQYASGQDNRFFVHLLHHVLGSIDLVLTPTEKAALLLENELIKEHQPRFNVRLKDDKRFLHLRIASDQDFPRLEVVRKPARDDAQYFGPYASASSARAAIAQINRHFQLRTCTDAVFRNRIRPCLEHQIGRCPGPCVLPVPVPEYQAHVRDVTLFLSGRRGELLDRLRARMQQAAADEHYEQAARNRDQILALEQSLEQQHVNLLNQRRSIDALGMYREGARAAVAVLTFREGVLLGSQGFVLRDQEFPDGEVIEGFASQLYDRGLPVPDEVLLPMSTGDDALAEWLTDLRKSRAALEGSAVPKAAVEVTVPQRGMKARLTAMANDNAKQAFEDQVRASASAQATLAGLQRRLHLLNLPRRIECYDISNISGTDAVGSMSVALDAEMTPREYRTFAIRSMETPNDFAMMTEVLDRRFRRAQDSGGPRPDLVLVDGGRGQLKMAQQVLADLGIHDVELASLAKARTLDGDDLGSSQHSDERVFLPGIKNALVLPQNSNELYLLVQLRDEAHRVAITFHRKRRQTRQLTSTLDAIPGVGAARKKALLQAFGSLKGIAQADHAAVAAVPGIGPEVARRVLLALGNRDT